MQTIIRLFGREVLAVQWSEATDQSPAIEELSMIALNHAGQIQGLGSIAKLHSDAAAHMVEAVADLRVAIAELAERKQ